ncbi:hypothetical protein WDU94_001255 [Cyamophila willieti]
MSAALTKLCSSSRWIVKRPSTMSLETTGPRLVLTLALVALTLPSVHCAGKNRTDYMYCLHCKGPDDFCLSTNETLKKRPFEFCAKPIEQCYTMVQTDGVRTIITRGCAHTRFCQFAKRVKLYDLQYCKQCSANTTTTDPCNNEDKFELTDLYYDEPETNRSLTNLGIQSVADLWLTMGMLMLLIMSLRM